MGLGNYTEADVKNAARAFTGWTIANPIPGMPYGRYDWEFEYRSEDHDHEKKTFLGYQGRFNGGDIIDIIVHQPATAMFIGKRLYEWFVSDEPDQAAINVLADAYLRTHYDMRSIMRILFHSEFFKSERAYCAKVKSPTEVVVGTLRLVGSSTFPDPDFDDIVLQLKNMGQELLNPPSVAGWPKGNSWIDPGSLAERINFVTRCMADLTRPGIQIIIGRLEGLSSVLSPEQFVDNCLDLLGPFHVAASTREVLLEYAMESGDLYFQTADQKLQSEKRIREMLQVITATPEYQLA